MTEGSGSPPEKERTVITEADLPPEKERIVITEADLPPQIAASEGAMAHEKHGYSTHTPDPSETTEISTTDGTKIPVRYDEDGYAQYTDANGLQLATGDDISPGSPLVDKGYEHNRKTAEVMAHAEDPQRTDAGEIDEAANLVEEVAGSAESETTHVFDDALRERLNDRRHAATHFVEEHGDHPGFEKAGTTAREAYLNQTGFSYQGYEVAGMRRKSEELRERATEMGELAKSVHENPISDAFKAAYPDIDLNIQDVYDLLSLQEEMDDCSSALEELEGTYEDEYKPTNNMHLMAVIEHIADPESRDEVFMLIDDEELAGFKAEKDKLDATNKSTIEQYQNLLSKLFEKAIASKKKDLAEYETILSDIKSGRASDPDYDPTILQETRRHDASDLGLPT